METPLTLNDYIHAGEVVTLENGNVGVHCAFCMEYTKYSDIRQVGWTFERHTVGWLCPPCHALYRIHFILAARTPSHYYHLYCAIAHNIVTLNDANIATQLFRNDRELYMSFHKNAIIGYWIQKMPDDTLRWCEVCGSKLLYQPY